MPATTGPPRKWTFQPEPVPGRNQSPVPGTNLSQAAAEVAPLGVGAGQPQRLAVADRRLLRPSQAAVQVRLGRGQQVVTGQLPGLLQRRDQPQPRRGTVRHAHRDSPVELDHRRRQEPGQLTVEAGDLGPVGVRRAGRGDVAGGDGRLHLVRPQPPEPQGALEHRDALADRGRIPPRAVLVFQGHDLAVGVQPRGPARIVHQHQRQQSGNLGLGGHQPAQHAAQPDRLRRQPLPDQVRAGGRRVALVEQQVEHAEHARQAVRQQVRGRHPVGDPGLGDLLLGPDQPLGHGRLAGQERPGDLRRGQAGQRAQRQRDPGLERQRRVAAGEHQPQPVVGDPAVVGLHLERRTRIRLNRQRGDLAELGRPDRPAAQHVDGPVAGRRGQPGPRPPRNAVARPALQGRGERVLGALLGQVPVAGDPDERGHDPAPLLPERGVDRRLDPSGLSSPNGPSGLSSMSILSRHCGGHSSRTSMVP